MTTSTICALHYLCWKLKKLTDRIQPQNRNISKTCFGWTWPSCRYFRHIKDPLKILSNFGSNLQLISNQHSKFAFYATDTVKLYVHMYIRFVYTNCTLISNQWPTVMEETLLLFVSSQRKPLSKHFLLYHQDNAREFSKSGMWFRWPKQTIGQLWSTCK